MLRMITETKNCEEIEWDCAGLITGAMMLMNREKYEVHGINYFAMAQDKNLHRITDISVLAPGNLIHKAINSKQGGTVCPPLIP